MLINKYSISDTHVLLYQFSNILLMIAESLYMSTGCTLVNCRKLLDGATNLPWW